MCDDVPRFIIIAAFLLDLNNSKHKPTREKYNQNQKINCTNKKWSASFFFLLNISLLLDLSTNEQYLHSTEMWWPKLYTNLDRILLPIFSHVAKYTIIYNKIGGEWDAFWEKLHFLCVYHFFVVVFSVRIVYRRIFCSTVHWIPIQTEMGNKLNNIHSCCLFSI